MNPKDTERLLIFTPPSCSDKQEDDYHNGKNLKICVKDNDEEVVKATYNYFMEKYNQVKE